MKVIFELDWNENEEEIKYVFAAPQIVNAIHTFDSELRASQKHKDGPESEWAEVFRARLWAIIDSYGVDL